MEVCKTCACNCKPVNYNCIANNTNLQVDSIQENHINNANNDIGELIGAECAEELCQALNDAAEQAETDGGIMEDYLATKWLNIINNKFFLSWYSYKVQWHFMLGASISSIESDSLVVRSLSDPNYQGSYNPAEASERKRLERQSQYYYERYRDQFLESFWYKNIALYDCAKQECGCSKTIKCPTHCDRRPPKIGMVAINY